MYSAYMHVDSTAAAPGRHITMLSPPFDALRDHCLLFDYKVWMAQYSSEYAPSPRLEIYLSPASHMYSGSKVWGSNSTGEGHAQIEISARPGAILQRVAFVGVVGDPDTTLIVVANVRMEEGSCGATGCKGTLCSDAFGCSSLSAHCKHCCNLISYGKA